MGARHGEGIISAGHPVTVEAGLEILKAGGNAVDAAVAAAFTSMVAEPMLTDIGGGGYMLTSSSSGDCVYDFFVRGPGFGSGLSPDALDFREIEIDFRGTTQRFHVGLGAAAVPGNVSGLCTAHEREGSLPLSEVIAPALHHARTGVVVTEALAFILEVIGPIFQTDPTLNSVVTRDNRLLQAGDVMDYSHVAPVLEILAREGSNAFYRGDIAAKIATYCEENGGLITREDLAKYSTHIYKPIVREVGGHTLRLNGPPATGGALVAFMLQLCEGLKGFESMSHQEDTRLRALAMHVANLARAKYIDPLMGKGLTRDPLDDSEILETYRSMLRSMFYDGAHIDDSSPEPTLPGNTTHISVIDKNGNAAAITTSNGEGSGCLVPECGVHLNNMLGEEDLNPLGFHLTPAGGSLPSMMCPMIIDGKDGGRAVLGSGGSNRIRTALFQTAYWMMFKKQSVTEAILTPRMHVEKGLIQAESGISETGLESLSAQGLEVNRWSTTNLYFGGVHGVASYGDGTLEGHGDPRRGGRSGTLVSEDIIS